MYWVKLGNCTVRPTAVLGVYSAEETLANGSDFPRDLKSTRSVLLVKMGARIGVERMECELSVDEVHNRLMESYNQAMNDHKKAHEDAAAKAAMLIGSAAQGMGSAVIKM